jgi:hypothetical protein
VSLPRAFAAAVVSGALLTGAAALAPAASASTGTVTVTSTARAAAPKAPATAPAGHLRVVISGVLGVTLLGHLR